MHKERKTRDCSEAIRLVDLLDGWAVITAGTTWGATGHAATGHTAGHATLTTSSVELHHDGVGNGLKLLLLRLVLVLGGSLVVVQPGNGLVDLGLELLLVTSIKLLVDLGVGESVAEGVSVGLESVLGRDTGSLSLILSLVDSGRPVPFTADEGPLRLFHQERPRPSGGHSHPQAICLLATRTSETRMRQGCICMVRFVWKSIKQCCAKIPLPH